MFGDIIADYLVALQMLREARWESEKQVAQAFADDYLSQIMDYQDFPVLINGVNPDKMARYENWFLALERVREEVIRIRKSDHPGHLLDYLQNNPTVAILYYQKEGVKKYEIVCKMAEVWLKKETPYQGEYLEKRYFLISVLRSLVIEMD
jgi:hypothetical protein